MRDTAFECFNKKLYFEDKRAISPQVFIDALTGEKKYMLTDDTVSFNETEYFKFPFTAYRDMRFSHEVNKNKIISIESLYLYDSENFVWLPISERKVFYEFEGSKAIRTKDVEENLWDKESEWSEPTVRYAIYGCMSKD